MKGDTTIVIGLDGAHFELIAPWLEKGDLPNIRECIENGVAGDMEACLPPVTSPNWKCYSTGKNPGKLGIFWWEHIDKEKRSVYYPTKRKMKHKEIWDYLSEEAYKVCVINTPLTFPPKQVNGVLIAGGPDASDHRYTYPPALEKRLKEEYNYRVHPKTSLRVNKSKAIREIHNLIDLRFKVALDLMEEGDFDFVQITTFYLNALQHFFWNEDVTRQAWKIIDKWIGRILEETEEKINLILMSDHGSNRIDTVFNLNTWLQKEGYLKYNTNYRIAKILSKIGITQENLLRIMSLTNVKTIMKAITPKGLQNRIPGSKGELKKEAKTETINWDASDAVASGQGPLYLLSERKKEKIKQKLNDLVASNGESILKHVYDKQEIYHGEYMDEAPDLILDQAKHIHINGSIGKEKIFEAPKNWRGENKKTGLFVGYGPDVRNGTVKNLSIVDLATTILKLYGIEKPEDMDGKAVDLLN